jgi:hypothetical protein
LYCQGQVDALLASTNIRTLGLSLMPVWAVCRVRCEGAAGVVVLWDFMPAEVEDVLRVTGMIMFVLVVDVAPLRGIVVIALYYKTLASKLKGIWNKSYRVLDRRRVPCEGCRGFDHDGRA